MTDIATDWWRTFFTDVFVDLWLQAVPEEWTRAETRFLQKMLQVSPPARLLDVPCGGGRHSLILAAAGYRMTGVDISADFLTAAREQAARQDLAIDWLQSPMRDIPWRAAFDGAFCFGNSFGYDTDEGNGAFLKAVARSLKPGARFVLDCPSVLEARLPTFQERNWHQIGDIIFLEDERYDPGQGRTVTEYIFLRDGQVVRRWGSHRNYTFRQVVGLLEEAGFVGIETFGALTEDPFRLGSEGLFLVATKPGDDEAAP